MAIGILGGMGPMATIDFAGLIVSRTNAMTDQEHVPLLIYSIPQVPDRTHSLNNQGPSPLPMLLKAVDVLNNNEVNCIAMPCNTAHYWLNELTLESRVPVLNMVNLTCNKVAGERIGKVGLLATDGTIQSGLYRDCLLSKGVELIKHSPTTQQMVMKGIHLAKAGEVVSSVKYFERAITSLQSKGAQCVILGCTEIPMALRACQHELVEVCIDSTSILADECIDFYCKSQRNIQQNAFIALGKKFLESY